MPQGRRARVSGPAAEAAGRSTTGARPVTAGATSRPGVTSAQAACRSPSSRTSASPAPSSAPPNSTAHTTTSSKSARAWACSPNAWSRRARRVVAVEIDPATGPALPHARQSSRSSTGDILRRRSVRRCSTGAFVVVANLPYHITSPALRHLLERGARPKRLIVMMQRRGRRAHRRRARHLSALAVSCRRRPTSSSSGGCRRAPSIRGRRSTRRSCVLEPLADAPGAQHDCRRSRRSCRPASSSRARRSLTRSPTAWASDASRRARPRCSGAAHRARAPPQELALDDWLRLFRASAAADGRLYRCYAKINLTLEVLGAARTAFTTWPAWSTPSAWPTTCASRPRRRHRAASKGSTSSSRTTWSARGAAARSAHREPRRARALTLVKRIPAAAASAAARATRRPRWSGSTAVGHAAVDDALRALAAAAWLGRAVLSARRGGA